MQNSMDEILTLISQATSPQVHARIAELLHTLLNTCYQEFLRNQDKRDHVEKFQVHTKKLLDISLELLSSDMANMQYLALITINRLYDVYVYHNLINPGRYNACYIPPSRRQLTLNSMINVNSSTSNSNSLDDSKYGNDRLPKTSALSSILRKISRETDEKRAVAAAATGGGSSNTYSSSKVSSNTTQQTSGPGPGGGGGGGGGSGSSGNTGILTREASKRWIPLYSNNDNIAPTSSSSPVSLPSSSANISTIQGQKTSSIDSTTNPQISPSNLSKSHLLNSENLTTNNSSTISNDTLNAVYTYEPFSLLYQIEPIHLLRLMRTRLDAHRREFNNRPKCVPSTRSPLCTHHCVVILAARILTILCQDHTFQMRFISTKENLAIIIDMLNINNDPHLICLILQTLGVLALNPDSHEILTQADIPDTVLHLILPADEMFYTNQTTKFARYVKHLGARILIYMGLLTKVSNKVNLFDILDVEPEPLDCDKPQSFENNFVHHMAIGETVVGTLWTSFAGICIEKLLDELLKNGINPKRSTSKECQDSSQVPTSPTSSPSVTAMINSSDSLLYNLSYLSSVIHPVIILRLLEHRLFTPLFKKKSVPNNPISLSTTQQINDNKNSLSSITPNIGTSALASIPTLPRLDPLKQQRNSLTKDNVPSTNDRSSLLTKFTQSTYDKHRKVSKNTAPQTSLTGIMPTNTQILTNTNLPITSTSSGGINANDLSLLLTSAISSSSSATTTNTSNQPSTARKWFWRYTDKNTQSNITNDRNPLLQAIVETDSLMSKTNIQSPTNATANVAGVGEIKLLEKELLNLPSFQLSDSQNPLLPSPTCLNYDFSTQFDQTNSTTSLNTHRQYSSPGSSSNTRGRQTKNLFKSKINDEDCKLSKDIRLCPKKPSLLF
ncbi:unnamed protein product [Rotaria sp. Silwood2]|nr:unnamed protein product [Rotaria sp. Silwood2]CAF4050605.1 unnamed protein product [Rotaria sp. Silwood2]CAF4292552.1 unnamed protein product [Rotaria sp. Silwood2]